MSTPLPSPHPQLSPAEGIIRLFNSIYWKHSEHLGHWEDKAQSWESLHLVLGEQQSEKRVLEAAPMERLFWFLRSLLKRFKKQIGANRLQKSWDLFHLRRTWFKTVWVEKWEAELESSIFSGFLTPEQMLILPRPSVPCYLRFRCGVTSLSGLAWAQAARSEQIKRSFIEPTQPLWPSLLNLYQCGLTGPKRDIPVTEGSDC